MVKIFCLLSVKEIGDNNINKRQLRDLIYRLRFKTTERVTHQVERENLQAVRRHAAYSRGIGGGPPAPPAPRKFLNYQNDRERGTETGV